MSDIEYCQYDSDHFRKGIQAKGTIMHPVMGYVPACDDCVDHFDSVYDEHGEIDE